MSIPAPNHQIKMPFTENMSIHRWYIKARRREPRWSKNNAKKNQTQLVFTGAKGCVLRSFVPGTVQVESSA